MSKLFYVYEHWRPDTDACFYVGKGRGRRANEMYGRNRYHLHVQNKLNRLGMCVEVRMFAEGLAEDDAFGLEIDRIAFWLSVGVPLANLTAGGEGGSNPSDETRALMRARKLGRKLTAEHRAKIAEKSRLTNSDPVVRAKIRASSAVTNATSETKAKRSRHSKSMIRTAEHYAKVSAALTGRRLSREHAAKSRVASVGRKQSPEEVEKRRAANVGRPRTDEQRQRMRDAQTPARIAKRSETRIANHASITRELDCVLKKCLRCDSVKDTSEFTKRKLSPDGIHVYCRECNRASGREYKARVKNKLNSPCSEYAGG